MTKCKLYSVHFYNPDPQAIKCMALKANEEKLALSRSDASIEIWNLSHTCFLERRISSTAENFSVEGLVWCNNRLFSTGLHGFLIEYNLRTLAIENKLIVTGEAAHCLDVSRDKSKIAVGTEKGYVNLFDVIDDNVNFNKFFDKQEGRIVCLKFDPTGEFVVSGGVDAIRIWNVNTGHAIHKMSTGRSETDKPTIVWCVDVCNDFTIVSGDSRGKLTFWDGKIGAQIENYQSHKADIKSICLSESQTTLYCSGVDPNIVSYERVHFEGGAFKWVKSVQRKIHEHTVNSMVICGRKLYSGGTDSYLTCSFHPPKTLWKFPPVMQNPCVYLAPEARYVMLRYPTAIEVWRISRSDDNVEENYIGRVKPREESKKLLTLQKCSKANRKEGIMCCAISNNGKWIFYSTQQGSCLFQFECSEEKVNLHKLEDFEHKTIPCVHAVFTHDSSSLITAPNTGNLNVYELKNGQASFLSTVHTNILTDTITFLSLSSCDNYLIAGDPASNIVVWNLKNNNQWMFHCKLPKHLATPTALAVHPLTLNLVIAYSDNKLIEYNLKKKHFTLLSKMVESAQWKARSCPIRNITFDKRVRHVIIVHDDLGITSINKEQKISNVKAKISKMDLNDSAESLDGKLAEVEIFVAKKYKHLVHVGWFDDEELIAVEVNPWELMRKLPAPFAHKTFGKK